MGRLETIRKILLALNLMSHDQKVEYKFIYSLRYFEKYHAVMPERKIIVFYETTPIKSLSVKTEDEAIVFFLEQIEYIDVGQFDKIKEIKNTLKPDDFKRITAAIRVESERAKRKGKKRKKPT